jgi:hypothetical protein
LSEWDGVGVAKPDHLSDFLQLQLNGGLLGRRFGEARKPPFSYLSLNGSG